MKMYAAFLRFTLLHVPYLCLTQAHPQCVDSFPPFKSMGSNMYCSHYSEFGCCDIDTDRNIRMKIKAATPKLIEDGLGECIDMFKEILCQECSPYAAHVFDTETGGSKKPVGGICRDYCADLYQKCSTVIPQIIQDQSILDTLHDSQTFCDTVAILDKEYCYPDILENTDLNVELNRVTSNEEDCLCLEEFKSARGLANPLIFAVSDDPAHAHCIYIATQAGIIYVFENLVKLSEPFLNISDRVAISPSRGDERGLIGFAFHPNFAITQKIYIHYIRQDNGTGEMFGRVSEFKTIQGNLKQVDADSEKLLLDVHQFAANHNGGSVLFGADGFLYIFIGDGGKAWDPMKNGQNKQTLLSTAMRIDVDKGAEAKPYDVPSDNPFMGDFGAKPEIYAYGLRNPFRASMDRGDPETGYGRGRIFIGDIGQNMWEEVNILKKGANYGWSIKEGPRCIRSKKEVKCNPKDSIEPYIYTYNHTVGLSVIGGYVYRGCNSPNLNGLYFFADYSFGNLYRLKEEAEGSNIWTNKKVAMCGSDVCFNHLTNVYGKHILTFGEDFDGEMYIVTTDYPAAMGELAEVAQIFRLTDPRRRRDPSMCKTIPLSEPKDQTYFINLFLSK